MKLYCISSKGRTEDRRCYLHSYMDHAGKAWGWTTSPAHADAFPRDEALRHAKFIRRHWKVPARVEAVS